MADARRCKLSDNSVIFLEQVDLERKRAAKASESLVSSQPTAQTSARRFRELEI